ncbi:class 1 fructose-bisphosphatase [Sulfitobacter guttiformis]|uniref:Fructose-1,6-bisphosphatase class 1 n=1 Tax=Sulfitobacter guttiformis TaxID=74349 RepID=J7FW52_9RHOB|nr:class 1 fructose-bisphosphatase [Sulfitobacter guttiformis]AFP55398.1 fructose-1,6-bisphosphatase class 1 [Sulfitobacter guttiformis]KIN75554.1 Fructose-1,6-bisphosphatase class 1 [Sulfitobacter guttiformis KCTC 32187]RKE91031.1 D-fructose 1,6-bisphosphatase [Sulfitobacter guttiformis]
MTQTTLRAQLQGQKTDTDLLMLMEDIATACQMIADRVRHGAFAGVLGTANTENIQGETQKELDVISDEIFQQIVGANPTVAALVSEEVDEVNWRKQSPQAGDFVVYYDPLDGSSNLDVNLSVGTIFSIVRLDAATAPDAAAVQIKGTQQIAAGYAIYGPSTGLVITVGQGVDGFTHHPGSGEFLLTQPAMNIPPQTQEFAINTSRYDLWEAPVRKYIDDCLRGASGPRAKKFNMRWCASMVADVHRILIRGGVFLYPKDSGNAAQGGKLRLMYEANPMGMLVEQAGGASSTGRGRIMEVDPTGHHQRVPVILGSRDEVAVIEEYYRD